MSVNEVTPNEVTPNEVTPNEVTPNEVTPFEYSTSIPTSFLGYNRGSPLKKILRENRKLKKTLRNIKEKLKTVSLVIYNCENNNSEIFYHTGPVKVEYFKERVFAAFEIPEEERENYSFFFKVEIGKGIIHWFDLESDFDFTATRIFYFSKKDFAGHHDQMVVNMKGYSYSNSFNLDFVSSIEGLKRDVLRSYGLNPEDQAMYDLFYMVTIGYPYEKPFTAWFMVNTIFDLNRSKQFALCKKNYINSDKDKKVLHGHEYDY